MREPAKQVYESRRDGESVLIVRVKGKRQRTFFRSDYPTEAEWRKAADAHREHLMSAADPDPPVLLQRRSVVIDDGQDHIPGVRRKPKEGGDNPMWIAEWNPEPHVTVRRTFSVRRWGEDGAKAEAQKARKSRSTKDGRKRD
jgi:hypothetical protein